MHTRKFHEISGKPEIYIRISMRSLLLFMEFLCMYVVLEVHHAFFMNHGEKSYDGNQGHGEGYSVILLTG